jgi:LysM repeat protein
MVFSSVTGAVTAKTVTANTGFTVKAKETLYRFSLRCHQSLPVLRRFNKLSSDTLRIGQRIRCATQFRPAVSFTRGKVAGITVNIVRLNLANPAVRLGVLVPRAGMARGGERLEKMYARSGAIAAINGGFFNIKTYASAGDIVANRRLLALGQLRTALAIGPTGRARVVDWTDGNQRAAQHASNRWRGFITVIGNGPHIINNGLIRIRPRSEGYRDRAILNPNPRSAIGLLNDHEIVLVSSTQKITLEQLARVMQKLGSHEALVLDGGSSTGMIWRGKTVVKSLRRIAYGIAVFGP